MSVYSYVYTVLAILLGSACAPPATNTKVYDFRRQQTPAGLGLSENDRDGDKFPLWTVEVTGKPQIFVGPKAVVQQPWDRCDISGDRAGALIELVEFSSRNCTVAEVRTFISELLSQLGETKEKIESATKFLDSNDPSVITKHYETIQIDTFQVSIGVLKSFDEAKPYRVQFSLVWPSEKKQQ